MVAHFAESGGIFAGAEVSYRGVTVGQVGQMDLTEDGVDVVMDIDNDTGRIPSDTKAVVANRSAVGEQFVDLQPETKDGPYLEDGTEIPMAMTETPISTTKFLVDIDTTVNSVNKQSLTTVVGEMGKAFKGTGQNLGQIIDTSNSFIRTANDNFEVTTSLLEDGNTVLTTQLDKASAIKSFARDLSLFSDTLVSSDKDLRRVINNGSATANQLRTFLEENDVDLGELINNLVTTGRGDQQAHRRHRDDPAGLPLRGGRRLHRGRQGLPDGPVRRPLRPDHPAGARPSATRATRAPTPAARTTGATVR